MHTDRHRRTRAGSGRERPAPLQAFARLLFFSLGFALAANAEPPRTNVASFRSLTRLQANRGVPLSLQGTLTLADSDRNLFVIQDSTGAIAIRPDLPLADLVSHSALRNPHSLIGEFVSVEAQSASPSVVNFPDYPYRLAGSDIRANFEAPSNWGNFHLTRMSGFLHPPVTGQYLFWIASDNSSELWLSPDQDPKKVRNIASLRAGLWVNEHEWSRYPSQRSDPIPLEAGRSYYIEAFAEQLEQAEHLAVAWQGPGIKQSIIAGQYVTPFPGSSGLSSSPPLEERAGERRPFDRGLLREYWTNFALGSLAAITADRPPDFAISAHGIKINARQTNAWPEPRRLDLSRPLPSDANLSWVEVEGALDMLAVKDGAATLELKAGQNHALVRIAHWRTALPVPGSNWNFRVQGVCEGAASTGGSLMPGTIWADSDRNVTIFELQKTNLPAMAAYPPTPATNNSALGGFFLARGVVTFIGRALEKDHLVVQDANAGIFISQPQGSWPGSKLRVGDFVEIGGNLLPYRYAPRLRPSVVNALGTHILPDAVTPSFDAGASSYRDGQWTEISGVVRAVRTNGMIAVRRGNDSLNVWLGETPGNDLESLVDSTLRLRGVISMDTPEAPLMLVPSAMFLEVLETPSTNLQKRAIADVRNEPGPAQPVHRVKISGTVTYGDQDLLFVQDDTGAVRVQTEATPSLELGDTVEVTGFPERYNSMLLLADANTRTVARHTAIEAQALDLNAPVTHIPNQGLVRVRASLLAQKNLGNGQTLDVQVGRRVLQAVLTSKQRIPSIAAESLLELTGIGIMDLVPSPSPEKGLENASIGSVRILLRDPSDVTVLRGPPWWSWKKAAVIIVILMLSLTVAILRVQLLRRRFEKQQAARLAFARQLLENQESERRRIAANLHDTLGQNLLAIKNQTHLAIQSATDTGLQRRLEDISGTVLHALEEVRQITHDLRPYQLDRLGLSQAIRSLVRKVSEGCPIELASHVDNIDGFFAKESEINIYRIVQEGINNVIKHSQATEAAVVLKVEAGALRISIRDNGRGLSPGQTAEDGSAGFGLSGIRERARIMQGHVEIDAASGQGFNLKIEIPLAPDGCLPEGEPRIAQHFSVGSDAGPVESRRDV